MDESRSCDWLPTINYKNGDSYIGRVDRRGLRQGKGLYKEHASGNTYDGYFHNSKKSGRGTLITPFYEYSGDFLKDQFEGEGALVFQDSSSYTGQFKNGKYHGR